MRKRKKFTPHLLIGLLSLIGFFLYINTFGPENPLDISFIKLPSLIPFFFLVFLSIAGVFIFITANIRRGILVGLFFVGFLLLQYLNVNNVIYTLILLAVIILLEFLFRKKR